MFIPIFPLRLVVFPDENINLHIFEPRYKQLIKECMSELKNFGIPVYQDKKIQDYGTEMEVLSIKKEYANGNLDVKCRGRRIFRVNKVQFQVTDKLYAAADVSFLENNWQRNPLLNMDILSKLKELYTILKIKKSLPSSPDDLWTYEFAHHVGFTREQEYDFLKLLNEKERQQMMADHLERMIPLVREAEVLKERVKLNGHFKNILPPDFGK